MTDKDKTTGSELFFKVMNSLAMGMFFVHVYLVNHSLVDAVAAFLAVFLVESACMAIFLIYKLGGSCGFLALKDTMPEDQFKSKVAEHIERFAAVERDVATVAALIGTLVVNRVYGVSMFTEGIW